VSTESLASRDSNHFRVPDFFRQESESALRKQVLWSEEQLEIGDDFFAKLLRVPKEKIDQWKQGRDGLPKVHQSELHAFWGVLLHLLSFQNFDVRRVRLMLENATRKLPNDGANALLVPPWQGSSMRAYLEDRGVSGIIDVDTWLTAFRFGDLYGPQRGTWLSTQR
jgi:hypothetical protein